MKPSQQIASTNMGEAYDQLRGENETLRTERDALAQALESILEIERQRSLITKRMPEAILAGKQVLETLEG